MAGLCCTNKKENLKNGQRYRFDLDFVQYDALMKKFSLI